MKRLLALTAAALICPAGAGLMSADATATTASPPIAAQHHMAARHGQPPTPEPSPPDQAAAAAKAEQAMHAVLPNAKVGFKVFDRRTGTVLASHNAGQQFASMSLVKLLIALDALGGHNGIAPDGAARQRLHQMLAYSDDKIASQLWDANGGPKIVTRMASTLGLTGTKPPQVPGQWGSTLITPRDVVVVYRYITDQLASADRDLILAALAVAPQTAADGFDQYFGIPDAMPSATWAIKQGWGTSGSQAVMTSTGLVGADSRYVVVVLASASARSYSKVPAVVTAGAGALADLLNVPTS